MSGVTEENRLIARTTAARFGGTPRVTRFWDDQGHSSVDILECPDRPTGGVTSYSTIGLSDHPLIEHGEEHPARLEIVGASASTHDLFGNIVSTAAFCVINDGWFCRPGAIFPDVVDMYGASRTMKHLLFVPPFLWADRLETLSLSSKTVAWLLAVPISESEREFARHRGSDALQNRFEQARIDVFDLHRTSTVSS